MQKTLQGGREGSACLHQIFGVKDAKGSDSKLRVHGVNVRVLLCFSNWLKIGKPGVGINGRFSKWREVSSGVP